MDERDGVGTMTRGEEPRKIDWEGVGRRAWKALVAMFYVAVAGVALFILALPYLCAHDKGYESKTEALAKAKRAETAKIEKTVETTVREIRSKADKEAALIVKPLERIDAERRELEKRKRRAGNRMTARRFTEDEGLKELAEDSMRIEKAIVKISGHCRQIRLLHAAFGKRQFMSASVREASASLDTLRKAHKRIMDDMEYASNIHSALDDK